ncbi:MAG: ATP-binding protein [Actinomycetota bacterium]|nr:ATP-binding protein [Actinomycetota bacterium]
MVGMVGAGKTTVARRIAAERHAVRLTPDEWFVPLFGQDFRDHRSPRRRDILEGRLVSVALEILRAGVDVVLDFGCWSRDERSALRSLAASLGAECELVYLPLSPEEQRRRVTTRWAETPHTTFPITDDDLAGWTDAFEVPEPEELQGAPPGPAPDGYTDWGHWAVERWPSLVI